MESYKYAIINSFDRPNQNESDTDFQTSVLGSDFDGLSQVALYSFTLTNSYYNVDSSNNTINFQENIGAPATAVIPIGSYSLSQILPVIKAQMEAVSPNNRIYTISAGPVSYKITISVNIGTFSILVGGLNLMMGFSTKTPTSQNASNTAGRVYNFSRYGNLNLITTCCKPITYNTITDNLSGILESIPVSESSSSDIYTYRPQVLGWRDVSSSRVDVFRVQLTDDINNIVNLNGGYMTMTLIFR